MLYTVSQHQLDTYMYSMVQDGTVLLKTLDPPLISFYIVRRTRSRCSDLWKREIQYMR